MRQRESTEGYGRRVIVEGNGGALPHHADAYPRAPEEDVSHVIKK